ncbi:COMPASS-like H3K4 histone methylase component WDR5A [Fusarium oxysporum f. sp. albedinis]|nr:COMPASS-like H3K4 histone methylase component WDR5A [Fusarium oxysporum f. sp. albedinis]
MSIAYCLTIQRYRRLLDGMAWRSEIRVNVTGVFHGFNIMDINPQMASWTSIHEHFAEEAGQNFGGYRYTQVCEGSGRFTNGGLTTFRADNGDIVEVECGIA